MEEAHPPDLQAIMSSIQALESTVALLQLYLRQASERTTESHGEDQDSPLQIDKRSEQHLYHDRPYKT